PLATDVEPPVVVEVSAPPMAKAANDTAPAAAKAKRRPREAARSGSWMRKPRSGVSALRDGRYSKSQGDVDGPIGPSGPGSSSSPAGSPWSLASSLSEGSGDGVSAKTLFTLRCASASALQE